MRWILAALVMLISALGLAVERGPDGYFHTGDGVRTKKVALMTVKVYEIDHAMKELPPDKSKAGVIDAEVDKKLSWRMLRTVDNDKIREALREAYARNGYSDSGKIDKALEAFQGKLKEGSTVTISYDAASNETTLVSPTGKSTVPGSDFMRATWSIWFGNIDQPGLTDALMSKMK
jgi:hypothetical protein